jgi:hypothetical protein
LIAFISSGSAAPDLSYSHLINHFLIPEITQSERLTYDTQLQGKQTNIKIVINTKYFSL